MSSDHLPSTTLRPCSGQTSKGLEGFLCMEVVRGQQKLFPQPPPSLPSWGRHCRQTRHHVFRGGQSYREGTSTSTCSAQAPMVAGRTLHSEGNGTFWTLSCSKI